MDRIGWTAILFALLMGGCFGKDSPGGGGTDPDEENHREPPGNGTSPPPPPPVDGNRTWLRSVGELPRRWEMSNCTYQGGAYDWLPFDGPGTVPPGWESDFNLLGSTIYLSFVGCERFSVGSFERSVAFAFEGHDKLVRPESCDNQYDLNEYMEKLWVNDAEVAAYLATYGINTAYAAIDFTEEETGGVKDRTWTLTPPGQETSDLTFRATAPEDSPGLQPEKRFVWWNGTVFGFMDWNNDAYSPVLDPATTHGHMEPYTMLGGTGRSDYVGTATWRYDMDVEVEVFLSLDTLCEEPL